MDSTIRQYFKQRRFSRLAYLSSEESWNEDDSNIGLYYFLLDLKKEDNSKILNRIAEIKGGLSEAYCYLGDIASELFYERYECDIALHFYRESLRIDASRTHALWRIYSLEGDCSAFIQAVSLSYESENYDEISRNFRFIYVKPLFKAMYSSSDWELIKSICIDERIEYTATILAICYFYLDMHERGIEIMGSKDWFNSDVLELYYEGKSIDFEYALEKMSFSPKIKFLNGDYERIYEETKKEAKKGNANPTPTVIINHAFLAKKYSDVICLVEDNIDSFKFQNEIIVNKLYHIISSLYLGLELNDNYIRDVEKQNFFKDKSEHSIPRTLYLAYLVWRNINTLHSYLEERDNLGSIFHYALYQDIIEYLSSDCLLNDELHDVLKRKLEDLKIIWKRKANEIELNELLNKSNSLSDDERLTLSSILLDSQREVEALENLSQLDKSMRVSNLRGVCYERLGDLDKACFHYKLAVDDMKLNGELDDVIISNYLSCIERNGNKHKLEDYDELVEGFNVCLANHFKYSRFTSDNGRSLFKYYPFNKFTLDSLVNGYFYLPSAEQLNDPIELPFNNLVQDVNFSLLRPEFTLSSFSNNENSMLMWSHYAENHSGLMVEYCFNGDLPNGVGIEKVSYSHTSKRYKEKELYLFNQYMLTKNQDWAYEKEVRLFAYKKDKLYYEAIRYPKQVEDKADAYISSITVGYKFQASMIKLIENIIVSLNAQRCSRLPKIELRRAKLSEDNFFELDYEVIT